MEKRITVHNPTAMAIYVGSAMIPPGETRDFPESAVPPHLRPDETAPEAETQFDALAELIGGSVAEVVAKLGELSDADLARLIELEEAGQARKTLIKAANEALNDRALTASAAALLDGSEDEVLAKIDAAADVELERAAEIELAGANREAVAGAIAAAQLKRKG